MRNDPTIMVTCDKCQKYEDEIGLTALARDTYDERHVNACLEKLGWHLDNGQDLCPDCVEKP